MENVLTLVATDGQLGPGIVSRVHDLLNDLGAVTAPSEWLAAETASDIKFSHAALIATGEAVRRELSPHSVDLFVQPLHQRRKHLLLADMDSTIVVGETLDNLAECVGLKEEISAITGRAMSGDIPFLEALRQRVSLLKGMDVKDLERVADRMTLTPGARTLVSTMRAAGAHTAMVSGGFAPFTERASFLAGFNMMKGNTLEIANGKITGAVLGSIVDSAVKKETLMDLAAERNIPMDATVAIGDGANDLPMLKTAGLGIAFHAKPVVVKGTDQRITYGDLSAALYAQGYHKEEFVE